MEEEEVSTGTVTVALSEETTLSEISTQINTETEEETIMVSEIVEYQFKIPIHFVKNHHSLIETGEIEEIETEEIEMEEIEEIVVEEDSIEEVEDVMAVILKASLIAIGKIKIKRQVQERGINRRLNTFDHRK